MNLPYWLEVLLGVLVIAAVLALAVFLGGGPPPWSYL